MTPLLSRLLVLLHVALNTIALMLLIRSFVSNNFAQLFWKLAQAILNVSQHFTSVTTNANQKPTVGLNVFLQQEISYQLYLWNVQSPRVAYLHLHP